MVTVSKLDPFFEHEHEIVFVRVEHSAVSQVGLEHAPLAVDESLADDHCKFSASVNALDNVLSDGYPHLEVPLMNAAF